MPRSAIIHRKPGQLFFTKSRIGSVYDLYRFLEGDRDTVEAYRGEYMSAYPWANITESLLTRRK